MPTYEYKCINNHFYEETRRITENPKETNCNECGEELSQKYHSPGLQLKGTGFYKNSR